ncbi:MAG: hypothetical protein QOI04_1839 [Verrucomicrobiota bacterium]|jgi:hypothetical protein
MHVPWIRVTGSPTHKRILEEWRALLLDETKSEEAYQRFVHEHAAFCLSTPFSREELVFSKLRLGADHAIDFGIASSQRSYGFVYTFIEIETPHEPAFTAGGNPSARLTHAMQQIRDWKAWLAENPAETKRLFPSKHHRMTGEHHFEFQILMGRRNDAAAKFADKRNQLADDNRVAIRSFDWVTDNIENARTRSFMAFSTDLPGMNIDDDNQFSNPFYIAFSDPEWRSFVDDKDLRISHMIGHNIAILRRLRQYNQPRVDNFVAHIAALPEKDRTPPDFEYEMRKLIAH